MSSHPSLTSTYRARSSLPTTGPLASYLLSLISVKQTNLCLSADVETSAELLQLAEDVGDSICVLKTHCDIVTDWSDRTAQALREIAKRKWFLIFEDRKFADIGGMSSLPKPYCLDCTPSTPLAVPHFDGLFLT
jgi:uridine monophosphate synthetase